jgi:hypothetical protein
VNAEKSRGSKSGQRLCRWTMILGAVLLSNSTARAALDIPIGTSFNGMPPTSPPPWVDLNFVDLSPGTVRLTITAAQLSSISFIQNIYFNFDDTKNVTSLTFTPVWSLWSGVNSYSLSESKNGLAADKGGKFDISLGFAGGNNAASQFNGGDRVVFDITSGESFSSASFAFKSYQSGPIPPNSSWYAAAFIQNTGAKNNMAGWDGAGSIILTSVPESSFGFASAGCCLAGLGLGLRRTKVAVC